MHVRNTKIPPASVGLVALAALGLAATPPAKAQTFTAASFSLPQTPVNGNLVNGLDGFDFTPNAALTVTALGWYDQGGDGLTHDHPVGIYVTATQALAAPSAVVTTASRLDATTDFRFTSVTPFTLAAGTTYTLVGYGAGPNFDPYVANPVGGIVFGQSVNFLRLRTSRSSGLEFPATAGEVGLTQNLFFGPNFQFASAPEPSQYASLGLGVLGVSALALRARRRGVTGA